MKPFATLTSPAIPLLRDHLDTEFIAPPGPDGRASAFARMRFDPSGRRLTESLFERAPFAQAALLMAGRNFGFGPRPAEAAAALRDLGLSCVVGLSFAPAFAEEALRAGVVCLVVAEETALMLAEEAFLGDAFTIDLPGMQLITRHGDRYRLSAPPAVAAALARSAANGAEPQAAGDEPAHLICVAAR